MILIRKQTQFLIISVKETVTFPITLSPEYNHNKTKIAWITITLLSSKELSEKA